MSVKNCTRTGANVNASIDSGENDAVILAVITQFGDDQLGGVSFAFHGQESPGASGREAAGLSLWLVQVWGGRHRQIRRFYPLPAKEICKKIIYFAQGPLPPVISPS